MMGRIAEAESDICVVTSDNPRREDPQAIIAEILAGIDGAGKAEVVTIADRREAITHALSVARSGDIVVIAGKGHEDYQILGDQKVHFDDREVVREVLQSIAG
jgi:UDP-N-acetylmuramoyl-L-alanyl-D-glutamate--2,6-diaminopimelate ligase